MHFRNSTITSATAKSSRRSLSPELDLFKSPERIIALGCLAVIAVAVALVWYESYSSVSDGLDHCVVDDSHPEGQSLVGIVFTYLALIYVMWLTAGEISLCRGLSKGMCDITGIGKGSMGEDVERKKENKRRMKTALKKKKGLKSRPPSKRLRSCCRLPCITCRFDEICEYMQPPGTWVSLTWLRHRLDRKGLKALDHMLNAGWLDSSSCGGYCRACPIGDFTFDGPVPNRTGPCPPPLAESNSIEGFVEVQEPIEDVSGPESDWEVYECSL
ncbi:hypothetical protein FOL47_003111 [Perkinsus chesapeaki]|uniref:Uncharacterized protein n=1 Tax=Perkinsus chesapeaki TaxID=330153 RepID=A0A7J6MA62_PERCH|nr:hypothetical protein FOL47_003111 [Perkinsus chesapeaki]